MPDAQIEFAVEISGEVQLHRLVDGRIGAVQDFRPFFDRVSSDFYAFESNVFAAGGAAEGLPAWPALTERYARWKARKFPGAGVLIQTGALRNALTDPKAPGAIYEISSEELRMGAARMTPDGKWDLGLIHQRGRADGSMPARPPLRLSRERRTRWMGFLADHISGES